MCFEGVERDLAGLILFGPHSAGEDMNIGEDDVELIGEVADELYLYITNANETALKIKEKARGLEEDMKKFADSIRSYLDNLENNLATFEHRLEAMRESTKDAASRETIGEMLKWIAQLKKSKKILDKREL